MKLANGILTFSFSSEITLSTILCIGKINFFYNILNPCIIVLTPKNLVTFLSVYFREWHFFPSLVKFIFTTFIQKLVHCILMPLPKLLACSLNSIKKRSKTCF